jgi:hypothetical protein
MAGASAGAGGPGPSVSAGWGRRFRIAIQGTDPRSRRPFIWHMFHARPGGGASAAGDGWPTAGEGQAAGGIKFGSIEVTEVRFPLFFRRHETLAQQLMEAAREVREEFEAQQQKMLPGSSPIGPLTFESDGKDGSPGSAG